MTKGRLFLILILFLFLAAFFYRYSPKRVEFLGHYNKVYAHRVNSLDKLDASLKYFEGIELDLDFNNGNNVLDVNHPTSTSINLSFETYLSKIPDNNFPFLWLDIKMLDTSNAVAVKLKLDALFEKKGYPKNQILIETLQPEALPIFTKAGYKTSYYLPIRMKNMSSNELDSTLLRINNVLSKQPEIGISTNHKEYGIITKFFPEKTKYIWALSSTFNPDYKTIRTILEDETVAIVLSPYRSFFGNR